jgi:hypothetical protein
MDIMIPIENNQLDKNDPDIVEFQLFLSRLRDSENIEEDWNMFRKK